MKAIITIVLILLLLLGFTANTLMPDQPLPPGKQIAFSRDKGNCLACHSIEDGEFPGNIGPALKNLPTRFKSKQQLREQIWDATQFNPQTSMPPFGKNKILTETEIDHIVDYLWGIK
jgi:L-cysteine S-thiosulfotransferase